jgi:hypothetical protein
MADIIFASLPSINTLSSSVKIYGDNGSQDGPITLQNLVTYIFSNVSGSPFYLDGNDLVFTKNIKFNLNDNYVIGDATNKVSQYYGVNFVDDGETAFVNNDFTVGGTVKFEGLNGGILKVDGTSKEVMPTLIVNDDVSLTANIADTKLATISTAGKVSNSATTATSANTASAIVARDGSGNFNAGNITAALTGNASSATILQTSRSIYGSSFNGSANIDGPVGVAYGGTGLSDVPADGEILVGNGTGYELKTIPDTFKEIYQNNSFGFSGPWGMPQSTSVKATKNLIDDTVTVSVGTLLYAISGSNNTTNLFSLGGIPSDFAPPVELYFPISVQLGTGGPALGLIKFATTGQITIYSNQDFTSSWAGTSGVTSVGSYISSFTWQL